MADKDNNASKQADEVKALSSIYEGAWEVVNETAYSIEVRSETESAAAATPNIVKIQIEMPPDYPSHSPPVYQLSAPWLSRDEKAELEASLQDIYCENLGESIVFLWVERIREFVEGKQSDTSAPDDTDNIDDIAEGLDQLNMCLTDGVMHEDETLHPCPEIYHGEPFSDRKSKFIAHLAPVSHPSQVQVVLDKLKEDRKVAAATHNILAYRISQAENPNVFYMGCEDDGETKAGSRLLHLLQTVDAHDVMVVVTRWYGGVHLGPDRFKHISCLARIILENCGYIKNKPSKKGVKSSTKKGR